VVPSQYPPGKTSHAPYEKRLAWAKACFKNSPVEVSSFEKGSSHTIFAKDIFYHYSAEYPTAEFFWILGEDQWEQIPYWKEAATYAQSLQWIVLPRNVKHYLQSGLLSRRLGNQSCIYLWAQVRALPAISSTKIRKCIEENKIKSKQLNWVPRNIRKDVIATYQRKKEVI
jgi:nicotinate (nicotinamide) nucleotide adenylyltransferase